MAPEVLQGKIYTMASDIYSFGMIMWELITGRIPFWDQNDDIELITKICKNLRPPIIKYTPKGYTLLEQRYIYSIIFLLYHDQNQQYTFIIMAFFTWGLMLTEYDIKIRYGIFWNGSCSY